MVQLRFYWGRTMDQMLDYTRFLRDELGARQTRNPSYSARAFARDLRLAPSYLSNVLKGSRVITEERAIAVTKALGWTTSKSKAFTTLVRYARSQDATARHQILSDLDSFRNRSFNFWQVPLDQFSVIREWYHYAILELTHVKGFVSEVSWIARRLGLDVNTVRGALARLENVGLIRLKSKPWQCTQSQYTTADVPSAAIREHHKQMLGLAANAIDQQSPEARDISGITMAIDPARLPEAKEKIRRFRREMMEFLEEGSDPSAVFQLSIQLFRLDRGE